LAKYDYNAVFYTPRTVFTMMLALLLLNFFAYTAVPMFDAGEAEEGDTKDGFKRTSKM